MEDMHTKKVIVEDADDDFREYISVSLFWMVYHHG